MLEFMTKNLLGHKNWPGIRASDRLVCLLSAVAWHDFEHQEVVNSLSGVVRVRVCSPQVIHTNPRGREWHALLKYDSVGVNVCVSEKRANFGPSSFCSCSSFLRPLSWISTFALVAN